MAQTEIKERPYCQDCRFFAIAANGKEYGRCGSPNASPVTAERYIAPEFDRPPYAMTMRAVGDCGDQGAWFEPTPSDAVAA